MVQSRDRPRLLRETIAVTVRERFDGDGPSEARVGRLVNLAHAPGAEERNDLVRSEAGTRWECHSRYGDYSGGLLTHPRTVRPRCESRRAALKLHVPTFVITPYR